MRGSFTGHPRAMIACGGYYQAWDFLKGGQGLHYTIHHRAPIAEYGLDKTYHLLLLFVESEGTHTVWEVCNRWTQLEAIYLTRSKTESQRLQLLLGNLPNAHYH